MSLPFLAVTGGIACGKSTVARMLPEFGGEVLDTDDVTHELQAPGGAAVAPIAGAFGASVLDEKGGVDRRRLAPLVFASPSALAQLNAIVHPLVLARVRSWLGLDSSPSAQGLPSPAPRLPHSPSTRFLAVLVPLLFEAALDNALPWSATLCIVCSEEEQIRRLRGRGLTEDAARARIASQLSCAEKSARSDATIHNDGSLEELRASLSEALRALRLA